jgi:hypothetical protein
MKNVFIVIFFLTTSCVVDVELEMPKHKQQLVLVGSLRPDSIVSVHLSKTISASDTSNNFENVDNANVELYENEMFVGRLEYASAGKYKINYKPSVGKLYSIKAFVEGHKTVSAEDIIPLAPVIEACYYEETKYLTNFFGGNRVGININIRGSKDKETSIWISLLEHNYTRIAGEERYDSTSVLLKDITTIYSDSNIPDKFNGFPNNGLFSYSGPVRIPGILNYNNDLSFLFLNSYSQLLVYNTFIRLTADQEIYILVTNTSSIYDKYQKSRMIHFINQDESLSNPFLEPVKIFSNVKNGLGIFAASNTSIVKLKNFPCN